MRVALISDIHGNKVALDAVLADLAQQPADLLVCLGDVAATGPQPRQVLQALQALGCAIVMGNTDEWLLSPEPWTPRDEQNQLVLDVELWSAGQLSAADRAFIRTFQPTVEVTLEQGRSLYCYHGSPQSYDDAIRPTTPEEELAEFFAGLDAEVLAGGHTHEPMVRRFREKLILNPGSVGLPLVRAGTEMRNPLWAEYALVEAADGRLQVALRRVPVDFERLREAVEESDMPHGARWLADWR